MRTRLAPLAALAAALVGCSAEGAVDGPLTEAGLGIIGGTPTSGDPAVVLLVSYPADKSTFDTCTASLVAPTVLLTAAHCVDATTHAGYVFGVFTGPDASAYPTAAQLAPQLLPISETATHPDYDRDAPFYADIGVALLKDPLATAPLPVQQAPLDASIEGAEARIVGYGQLVYKELNLQKHEATTVVAKLDAVDTLTVGDVAHKSCVGDSGGPALVVMDGVETIVGVDSYADTTGCLEPAHYRRPDLFGEFLAAYIPWSTGEGGAGGAGGAGGGESASGGGGAGAPAASPGAPDEGGCSLSGGSPATGLAALLLGALALVRRRRA